MLDPVKVDVDTVDRVSHLIKVLGPIRHDELSGQLGISERELMAVIRRSDDIKKRGSVDAALAGTVEYEHVEHENGEDRGIPT